MLGAVWLVTESFCIPQIPKERVLQRLEQVYVELSGMYIDIRDVQVGVPVFQVKNYRKIKYVNLCNRNRIKKN